MVLPGKRVLVVEDDAFARGAMSALLEAEGYQATSAANGREALGQLRGALLPDLILLDLIMPVMDGLEFCRRQSNDGRLADIPVLIVSARDAVLPDPSLVPQIVGHLVKPVLVDDLLAHVRRETLRARSSG
ncbi:MAG: response regulator [Planctomycetes bacterium]|nr:response regulator [Planctomycetota bacterium]